MSFVSTGEMTRKAQREGYAVPAFNAENLEMAQAIIQAASREGSPVILQTTLPTARYWGMEEAVAVTASLAQEAPVPVALHLDHSNSFDEVMRAARAGYTSLMFDGSAMSYEENLRLTGRVVEAVRPMGLTVEAELGQVGGKRIPPRLQRPPSPTRKRRRRSRKRRASGSSPPRSARRTGSTRGSRGWISRCWVRSADWFPSRSSCTGARGSRTG